MATGTGYDQFVTKLEPILGYDYLDKANGVNALLTFPLTFPNSTSKQRLAFDKNDRFAVYGDCLADMVLCGEWVETPLNKGTWTQARGAVLNNVPLAELGFRLKIDACVIKHPGTLFVSDRTMATTVEAIFASVYMDGGLEALKLVMTNMGIMERFRSFLTLRWGLQGRL